MDYLDTFNKEAVEKATKKVVKKPAKKALYKVKVAHPALRVRRAPNTQAEVVDVIRDEGIYEILDEANGWGKIDENKWIMLSYTEIA